MIQTAHFWKIFSHGHQSCQNTSENKKTAKLRSFKSQGTSDDAFTIMSSIVLKYLLRSFVFSDKKSLEMNFHSPSRPNFYKYLPYSTI